MSATKFSIKEVRAVNSDYSDLEYYHGLSLEELIDDQNEVKVQLDFNPEIDEDSSSISIFIHCRYVYKYKEKKLEVLHFDILNTFTIEDFKTVVSINKSKESIDLDFLITLVSISVSNSRGFISAKVGYLKNKLVLPIMVPDKFVREFKKKNIKRGRYIV